MTAPFFVDFKKEKRKEKYFLELFPTSSIFYSDYNNIKVLKKEKKKKKKDPDPKAKANSVSERRSMIRKFTLGLPRECFFRWLVRYCCY